VTTSTDSKPSWLVHASDVCEEEGAYPAPFDAEKMSFTRDLGQAAGSVRLGLRLERLPPGWRTSFTHAHSAEEELVYVLEGECVARVIEPGQAARELPLRAGHALAFPPGTGVAHTFVNRGERDCVVLAVGERRPGEDRVFYPEDPYDAHVAATRPARWWKREAGERSGSAAAAGGDRAPSWLVHAADVPEVEGHYPAPFDAEKLSFGRNLGRAMGSVNLGMRRERLPPGRRSGFTHAHSAEEELVYVLEGECLARIVEPGQPPRELPLRAGDSLSFPAGTGLAHTARNRGARDCVLLVVGERRAEDRLFYPDDPAYDAHLRATRPEVWWSGEGQG
jgi:uncharacterized cupin superfamily protein